MKSLTDFEIGGIKFPETKIGETVTKAEDWLSGKIHQLESKPPSAPARTNRESRPRLRGFRCRRPFGRNSAFTKDPNERSNP